MRLFIALFFASVFRLAAQSPEVPHKIRFADLTLTIRDDARREIQKDVDAFTRYPNSFNVKAARARTYFPVIEKIFREENVPDDFKFLVLQESALIPDAVSVSNAVGFWQFKDFTAIEMGLRVDKVIDERMNIVSASRAAAKYLKKNNTFFDNWLYALQAYQMGAGGVMRSEKKTQNGEKNLEITSSTYWYVKKFLAHKIAYEQAIAGEAEIKFLPYITSGRKTLEEIGQEVAIDTQLMKDYNKWVRGAAIPDDKNYIVMLPIKGSLPANSPAFNTDIAIADASQGLHNTASKKGHIKKSGGFSKINGVLAVKALVNENPTKLATRAGVDISAFLKWNDMSISDRVEPGQHYLLGKKRARATTAFHKVLPGENLWSVSQQYAVQIKKLKKYNRLRDDRVEPGTTLYLSGMKPKGDARPDINSPVVEVDSESFAWEGAAGAAVATSGEKKVLPPEAVTPDVTQQQEPEKPASVGEAAVIVPVVTTDAKTENVAVPDTTNTAAAIIVVAPADSDPVSSDVTIPANEKKSEHVVQPKETLYGISQQYGVTVMDLVSWNGLDLQQGIKPGQVLKVVEPQDFAKAQETPVTGEIEHEVKASDTVYSIARKYGVTIKELMEWNNKKDFTLSVGEKLKVHRP
jgi:membrane-bound lytic murein transglycosylase D